MKKLTFDKRRKILGVASFSFFISVAAYGKSIFLRKKSVTMNVVVFNYLNRPIFEVMLNHRIDGVAPPIGGGKSIVAGASIPLGVQVLTWRLGGPEGAPRNGETIIAKNPLALSADEIPNESAYLAIHVYPDATAELTFSKYLPDPTARGQEIIDNSKN